MTDTNTWPRSSEWTKDWNATMNRQAEQARAMFDAATVEQPITLSPALLADGYQLVIVNVPVKRTGDDWSAIMG